MLLHKENLTYLCISLVFHLTVTSTALENMLFVVYFLLGNSPASEFYVPAFQNTLSVPSSQAGRYEEYLPIYEDGTECSETLAHKIRTPGNYAEESTQHSEHGNSLKSRMYCFLDSSDNVVANPITSLLYWKQISYTKLFQVQELACLRNILDVT